MTKGTAQVAAMTWLTKLVTGRLKKDSHKLVDNEPELPCAKPEPKAAHHALASKLKRMVSQSQLLILRNTQNMRNNDTSTVEVSIQLNPFGVKVLHQYVNSPYLRTYMANWSGQHVLLTVVQPAAPRPQCQRNNSFRGTQLDPLALRMEHMLLDLMEEPASGIIPVLGVSLATSTTHMPFTTEGSLLARTRCEVHILSPLHRTITAQAAMAGPFEPPVSTQHDECITHSHHHNAFTMSGTPNANDDTLTTSDTAFSALSSGSITNKSYNRSRSHQLNHSANSSGLVAANASHSRPSSVTGTHAQARGAHQVACSLADWLHTSAGSSPETGASMTSKNPSGSSASSSSQYVAAAQQAGLGHGHALAFSRHGPIQLPKSGREVPAAPLPKPVSPRHLTDSVKLLLKIGQALQYLHQKGLVHGGLRPSTIQLLVQHAEPVAVPARNTACAAADRLSPGRPGAHSPVGRPGVLAAPHRRSVAGGVACAERTHSMSHARNHVSFRTEPLAVYASTLKSASCNAVQPAATGHSHAPAICFSGQHSVDPSSKLGSSDQACTVESTPGASSLEISPASPFVSVPNAIHIHGHAVAANVSTEALGMPSLADACAIQLPLPFVNCALLIAEVHDREKQYAISREDLDWAAPEVVFSCCGLHRWVSGSAWSRAGDVWSFGLLMWQLLCGERAAFAGLTSGQVLFAKQHCMELATPFHADTPIGYLLLAQRCLSANPAMRPPLKWVLSELEEQLAVLEGRADGAAFSLSFAMDSGELMADVQDMMGFSATSAARLTEHCQHNGSRAHGGAGSMEEDEDGSGPAASVRLIAKLNALIAPTPGCTHKPAAHASSIATQTDSLPPLLANLTGMSAAFGSVSGFGSGSGLVASPRMSFEASMPKRALSTGIWQRQGSMGNEGSPHNSSIFSRMQPGATPNTAAALGTQSLASVSALNATGTSAERTPAASLTDGSVQGTLIIGDIERSGSPGLSWAAWRQQASAHLPLPACMDEQTSSATGSCVLLAACMPSHTRALQSTQGVPHLIQPVHTSTEVSLLAATDCSAGVVTSATSQSSSELDQIGFDAEAMPAQPAPPSPPKTPSVFPLQPLQPPPQPKSSIGKIAGALTMDNAKGIGALRCAGVCSNLQDDPSLGSFDDALPLPLPLPLVI